MVDFTFSGDGLNVIYDETGFDGTPRFRYMGREFVGDAISTVVIPDLGKVVSVTIDLTVDTGSETLSILIPTVEPPPDTHPVSIKIYGIMTRHSFSPGPVLVGQQDFYTVTALDGTAAFVDH